MKANASFLNMRRIIKEIVVSFFICLVFFPLVSGVAKAQDINPWYKQGFKEWYVKVKDDTNPTEIFGERYTATQVQWVFYGIIAFIMDQTGDSDVNECLLTNGNNINECASVIMRAVQDLITLRENENGYYALNSLTSNPISFVSYVKSIKQKFSIVKEAKAQGFGFTAASSIQGLWQLTRDISYTLTILIVIAFSFMIMFRMKISPQTVITIQSALAKVVVSIILITFSYAIAGLLIDLMYLTIGILSTLLAGRLTLFSAQDLFRALTTERSIFSIMIYYFITFAIAAIIAFISGWAILAGPLMSLLAIIIVIIVFITLFFIFFKILWLLIKTYTMILLQIVTGPIQILIGSINPGFGFSKWIKNIVSLLSVYPVVGFMFLLAFLFLRGVFDTFTIMGIRISSIPVISNLIDHAMPFNIRGGFLAENTWSPPLTAGENAVAIIYLFVSFTIITLIPKTADIIKGMIEGKPFAYGTAIGEAVFGPVVTAGQVSKTGQEIVAGLKLLPRGGKATTPPPKPKIKAPPPGSVNERVPFTYE